MFVATECPSVRHPHCIEAESHEQLLGLGATTAATLRSSSQQSACHSRNMMLAGVTRVKQRVPPSLFVGVTAALLSLRQRRRQPDTALISWWLVADAVAMQR